jgi:ribosomal protein S18 acetylase RimI-like enzyme
MADAIELRPIVPGDLEFLHKVYAGTRAEELAATGWDDVQKETFLRMQFDLQHRYYQETFPTASYAIILWHGQPAGRLYVDRRPGEIALIDIALLPELRGHGIGSHLMQSVLNEAKSAGKPVRIHVEKFNRALELYKRLGFQTIGDIGVYYHMEWRAE